MPTTIIVILLLSAAWALAYHRAKLWIWTAIIAVALLLYSHFGHAGKIALSLWWVLFLIFALPLNILPLRRKLFSEYALNIYRKIMPKMSRTEREAIDAGTVSWEGQLFRGAPCWKDLLKLPTTNLSAEEQAFIDGPVEKLCSMINDWDITHNRADLPPEMWQFIKDHGFFGLIIPKQYGGKEFSACGHSQILIKIYSMSVTVASTVGVPNSLGPGELLLHYGTEQQKNYYLPRLARGEEIPCFALTNPEAGSDAGAIPDTGIVCRGEYRRKRNYWNSS